MKKTTKNNDFKIPDEYLEGFTSKLLDKIAEEKIDTPKNEGFKMPDNYFEELNTAILSKINNAPKEIKVIPLKSYKKYYYAVASVAAILLFVFSINNIGTNTNTNDTVSSLEIEAYFDMNDVGLTSYEIAEVIPVNELGINDILENQLEEENIMEYLENNIDDLEELNIQYNE